MIMATSNTEHLEKGKRTGASSRLQSDLYNSYKRVATPKGHVGSHFQEINKANTKMYADTRNVATLSSLYSAPNVINNKSTTLSHGNNRTFRTGPEASKTFSGLSDKQSSRFKALEEFSTQSESSKMGSRVSLAKQELSQECNKLRKDVAMYEEELAEKNITIYDQKHEINRLKSEIHKLECVLQEMFQSKKSKELLTLPEERATKGNPERSKRLGISAESSGNRTNVAAEALKKHEKNPKEKQFIKEALMKNLMLCKLENHQIYEMVDCMSDHVTEAGNFIIQEGESGNHLYVLADGALELIKNGRVLGNISKGSVFGELAILYNCTRTASVKALEKAELWKLDRQTFQSIMVRTEKEKQDKYIKFLQSVPLLKSLQMEKLGKIADVLEMDFYTAGEYIIRQGTSGDTFFIIQQGEVTVTQEHEGIEYPQTIRTLKRGDYFGEKALLSEDKRTANVIAQPPGVELLALDRKNFIKLVGELEELKGKVYGDDDRRKHSKSSSGDSNSQSGKLPTIPSELAEAKLSDFTAIATLGMGGFGRVNLVQLKNQKDKSYAMKCLKKKHIVDTRQQEHVYSEKRIMLESNCRFITRLYRTFKDSKYVYMLMDVCLGGELWTILRDKGMFNESTARFYTSCVIQAFEYLHKRGIVFRDLKPENLLLDQHGYAKLVDFGFAKKIGAGKKTWTFCGTPEYVSPEIILNKGHDHSADYWALGILIFEFLTGSPPFSGSDPMKTYHIILKGIDFIEFPKVISRTATQVIKRLCKAEAVERLCYGKEGMQEIKRHKWFQGFDWVGLNAGSLAPSIKTKIRSVTDHSNFDNFPQDTEVPPDENSQWDIDF